ncbi:ribosome maturation factor RimM [Pleionea sediminis]|uniref:ribosome maturation factor RimM n=1 Tax=Pleionea sediminis TaxID=2569479 RepID=UPI0011854264|nr:ribosome maturation factor RimM [Pleionea sediminis]
MAEDIVVIGKITSAFGVKGGVKIFSYTKPRLKVLDYDPWLLKLGGEWKPVKLLSGREQGKTIGAMLEGIIDRSQAEELAGTQIGIFEHQLPDLDSDEYYWRDLEGMQVVNQEGVSFGEVSHLIETGSNDVLVVRETAEQASGKKRKERMVPFTPDAVVDVNTDARLITVEWDADF